MLLQFFFELFLELVGGVLTGASLAVASRVRWIDKSLSRLHTASLFLGLVFLSVVSVSGSFPKHLYVNPLYMGLVSL